MYIIMKVSKFTIIIGNEKIKIFGSASSNIQLVVHREHKNKNLNV